MPSTLTNLYMSSSDRTARARRRSPAFLPSITNILRLSLLISPGDLSFAKAIVRCLTARFLDFGEKMYPSRPRNPQRESHSLRGIRFEAKIRNQTNQYKVVYLISFERGRPAIEWTKIVD